MNQTPQQVPHLRFAMLTYGALDATRRCVRSLRATTPAPFELYVVDNGSTDGTREWLAAQTEPWLSHRNNAQNRGVPGGRNDLLDFVLPQAAPTDWIVFIDNDLEFAAGWLDPFLAAMQQFPDARVLGKVGHFAVVDGERRHLCPAPGDTQPVDVVSGGFACFVRADAARAIGRFDEDLGLFDQRFEQRQRGRELQAPDRRGARTTPRHLVAHRGRQPRAAPPHDPAVAVDGAECAPFGRQPALVVQRAAVLQVGS
ncbi:MAG: glycosyltransferase, partial [Planctomycetes bacterium]|nr:glycosyltransferase [Planctomycetota bacterium]